MTTLPPPPVPADADLRHYGDMPLEVARLRDSDIASIADAEAFRCAVMLWCAAWHQVPAGSLPADDATLARMAGLGRDQRTWKRLRTAALRGFREFSDGRLYHRVVSEKVIGALNSTRLHHWNKACGRVRKVNFGRRKKKLEQMPMPDSPELLTLNWSIEHEGDGPSGNGASNSSGDVTRHVTDIGGERGKSSEGKGMESLPRGAHPGLPLGDVTETSVPTAARATGLEGPHARDADPAAVADVVEAATARLRVVS
jgi:hypothetical protein